MLTQWTTISIFQHNFYKVIKCCFWHSMFWPPLVSISAQKFLSSCRSCIDDSFALCLNKLILTIMKEKRCTNLELNQFWHTEKKISYWTWWYNIFLEKNLFSHLLCFATIQVLREKNFHTDVVVSATYCILFWLSGTKDRYILSLYFLKFPNVSWLLNY